MKALKLRSGLLKGVSMFNSSLTEQASQGADRAIQTTQRVANDALDSISSSVHNGVDTVRDTSRQLREGAVHASDASVNFIKHEPIKSVLIAAATGAALMALIGLLNRPHTRN
jgi:ElaB/YqjD/DUF883 family membrane-anchored ribosome-binding protein